MLLPYQAVKTKTKSEWGEISSCELLVQHHKNISFWFSTKQILSSSRQKVTRSCHDMAEILFTWHWITSHQYSSFVTKKLRLLKFGEHQWYSLQNNGKLPTLYQQCNVGSVDEFNSFIIFRWKLTQYIIPSKNYYFNGKLWIIINV